MSLDWTHQFCLACDKQTDGATYCSESCRLADYEKTSPASSPGPGSPALAGPSFDWAFPSTTSNRPFQLPPAYDFTNSRQQYRASQRQPLSSQAPGQTSTVSNRFLSPSNSHTSLCSMKSTSSADSAQLTEKATRELQAYARSFESVRLQRRRSY